MNLNRLLPTLKSAIAGRGDQAQVRAPSLARGPAQSLSDQPSCRIALIAHDDLKSDLIEWAGRHLSELRGYQLIATGTTGGLLADRFGLDVQQFHSGPLGGDQQIGAEIAAGAVDLLVFLWDPLHAQGHNADVQALIRLATLWNVPTAFNVRTADHLIASSHLVADHTPHLPRSKAVATIRPFPRSRPWRVPAPLPRCAPSHR